MKRILVVDDTKNIRILLTKCLEMEGFSVLTANDGQEALEQFKREKFDLVFLDIKLPFLSGTEVLKHIRGMGIMTPVIIITAYATVKNAVECTQMGSVAYLQKPFTADKVRTVLNEILDQQFTETEKPDLEKRLEQVEETIKCGLYKEAIEMLKAILANEPANPYSYLLFSKAYQGIGDTEHAVKFNNIYEILNTK